MSSPSLPRLSNELVHEIFTWLPDSRAVAALNGTSRKFYQVWRSGAAAISNTVLPRCIECYANAEELVRHQIAPGTDTGSEGKGNRKADSAYREVLKRNERFAVNASKTANECKYHPTFVNEQRRLNYLRLRYRVHCMAELSYDRIAQREYAEATAMEDLEELLNDHLWPDVSYR